MLTFCVQKIVVKSLSFVKTALPLLGFWGCFLFVSCDIDFESDKENSPPEIKEVNGEVIEATPENPMTNQWVTLSVEATDPDGDELRYFWDVQIAGQEPQIEPFIPSITTLSLASRVKFLPTEPGTYNITVSVVEGKGEQLSATRTLTVTKSAENLPLQFGFPAIIAVGQQPLPADERLMLVANPAESNLALEYEWSGKDSLGNDVSDRLISHESFPERHYFQSGEVGEFTITVKISDDSERDPLDGFIVITVTRENHLPAFDAQPFTLEPPLPPEQPFLLVGESVEIRANVTDEDDFDQDNIQYTWRAFLDGVDVTRRVLQGDLFSANTVFLRPDTGGLYAIETSARDTRGGVANTFVQIHVNTPPVFSGQGIFVNGVLSVGNDIELTADAVDDDNDAISYSWEAMLDNIHVRNEVFVGQKTGQIISFSPQEAGVYQVLVTVTDGKRGVATHTILLLIP
ncbi:MAG: hypothetical protein O7D34_03155 [Ignavibacteria bacterium]|nr:hypothetical protein [Ignavibacteria bacterium]